MTNLIISIALKTSFSYLYPWIDVKLYQKRYEEKISKGISCGWLVDNLFTRKNIAGYENSVPYYRVFQHSITVLFWGLAYIFFYSVLPFHFLLFAFDFLIGILAGSYYWMLYERLYYRIAHQDGIMYSYQADHTDVYWLKRVWFSGLWLFKKEFAGWKFDMSALIGAIIMYLSSLIHLIN